MWYVWKEFFIAWTLAAPPCMGIETPSHPLDKSELWWLSGGRGNIIRTALCWIVC